MSDFRTISSIQVDNASSWEDSIFLTFDIDWVHDSLLAETIDLVEQARVKATWFVTHDTPLLDRLRANQKFELGIHPNFNFLLEGDVRNGRNARDVIERLLAIVPEAISVRSHSMTQSSQLLALFKEMGLSYDVNHFVPAQTGIELKPWKLWNDLIRVPYYWEDDLHVLYESTGVPQMNPDELLRTRGGLKVFDFHPVHVFLNTESLDRYEQTRPLHQIPDELTKHRYQGYGTCNRLNELLGFATLR